MKYVLKVVMSMVAKNRKPNRLKDTKSPYLLQHAHNPVDWFPWGEEAFARAKAEDKPIFLSIGYSACHWCHVMADESFDDAEVAEVLNRDYVSVKVDREERPDIDAVYMNVCQALTGHGGWPLTIIMTPDQKPFYAGTYLPKRSKYGMHGLIELLELVSERWRTEREVLVWSGEEIVKLLKQDRYESSAEGGMIDSKAIDGAVNIYEKIFDPIYGGFGDAPKFPTPHNLLFLLRYSAYQNSARALDMVEKTLEGMYRGGLFDHVGYGFSRYSTDEKWLVPHFEKMLYDNALLAITYLEAFSATSRELYKQIAEKVLQYIAREMTSPEGAFYSAQDADSEGEEGKFYLLSPQEIEAELGSEIGNRFNDRFGVTAQGNFNRLNIPNLIENDNYEESDIQIDHELQKLDEYRAKRYHLNKDDKILTVWNGLMIAAYATAYKVTCDIRYLERAEKAVEFIEKHLSDEDGTLYVSYRNGRSDTEGFLDDYAYMAWAYLSLYESTFDIGWIEKCIDTVRLISDRFVDDENGGCYLYSHGSEVLISRPKETYDGALPSGNAIVGYVLSKLSIITGDRGITDFKERQLSFLGRNAKGYPIGHAFTLIAAVSDFQQSQLICALPDSEKTVEIRREINRRYLPNAVVIIKTPRNEELLSKIAPYTSVHDAIEGKPTFYLCKNYTCDAPTDSLERVLRETGDG